MDSTAGFGDFDDGGDVVGVAVHWNAAFDDAQGESFGLEVAVIDGNEGGELGAGGVTHHENAAGIAAVLGDVIVDPTERFGDIAKDGADFDIGKEAVTGGDENEIFIDEGLRLKLNAGFIAGLPAATMNPENNGKIFGGLG